MPENTPRRHGDATTLPPHPDVLVLVYQNRGVTPEQIAARLGVAAHEARSRIDALLRVGYVRNVDIPGSDHFETSRTGGVVAEEVIRADNEFWVLRPPYAFIGPRELAELRADPDHLVSKEPCPVPSCSGRRLMAPRIDLEWVCPTCGILEPSGEVVLVGWTVRGQS